MKEKFLMQIESIHANDRGNQENVITGFLLFFILNTILAD